MREEVLCIFREINESGQTILMVTHSIKAASKAGSSEKSSLIKTGISGTLKERNISAAATAPSMAVTVRLRISSDLERRIAA